MLQALYALQLSHLFAKHHHQQLNSTTTALPDPRATLTLALLAHAVITAASSQPSCSSNSSSSCTEAAASAHTRCWHGPGHANNTAVSRVVAVASPMSGQHMVSAVDVRCACMVLTRHKRMCIACVSPATAAALWACMHTRAGNYLRRVLCMHAWDVFCACMRIFLRIPPTSSTDPPSPRPPRLTPTHRPQQQQHNTGGRLPPTSHAGKHKQSSAPAAAAEAAAGGLGVWQHKPSQEDSRQAAVATAVAAVTTAARLVWCAVQQTCWRQRKCVGVVLMVVMVVVVPLCVCVCSCVQCQQLCNSWL